MSCLERCPYFRGVLIEGFHCIGWCIGRGPLHRGTPFLEVPVYVLMCVMYRGGVLCP